MTREHLHVACPDPQMLSAYLDGKLDATERSRIEDHISRCEDCYFVVSETAIVWADEATAGGTPGSADGEMPAGGEVVQATFGEDADKRAAPPAIQGPVADPRRPKTSSFARYFMPIAATLVVAAGALALWRQSQANADPRAALVEAVGERRFFDARLTGGFKFGERISPKRSGGAPGATGPAAEDWEILAAAAKIKADIGAPKSATERATLASAHLILGDVDEAVAQLEHAVNDSSTDPSRASMLSDLAAAYLARGNVTGREDDYPRALERAVEALEIDPNLREALYNRALALEALRLPAEALKAWDALLVREKDPGWLSEAQKRRGDLARQPEASGIGPSSDPAVS